MKTDDNNNNPKETFKNNLGYLCSIYIADKNNDAKSHATIYPKIQEYFENKGQECFSYLSFKKWLSGAAFPDSDNILMLCEFFGCDANYLFGTDYIDPEAGPNQSMSKTDKYILETYGLDRQTLEFFKKYKDCGINTIDDSDVPHSASDGNQSFSALFNELIHTSPWTINALLQIIYAKRLNLSSYGLDFAEVEERIISQPNFPGLSRHLLQDFDIDAALCLLAIRLKQLHQNPEYIPSKTNLIETYDSDLLRPSAIDDYISNLLSTRLKNLNIEIEELTTQITE